MSAGEVTLLTEAEVLDVYAHSATMTRDEFKAYFRERGLIAPEPVNPLLVEAREIALAHANWNEKQWRGPCLRGDMDANPFVVAVLAALRRGMELQREKLTQDVVREAHKAAQNCIAPDEAYVDRLHTTLLEKLDA